MQTSASRQVRKRARLYGQIKRSALRAADTDERLYWAAAAATFAWSHNFGVWRDDELEAVVEAASREFAPRERCAPRAGEIVYLVSTFSGGGGHTETLMVWSQQAGSAVVSSELEASDASLLSIPVHLCPRDLGPTPRIEWLCRKLAELRPETIILHILPNDVLALTAALAYRRSSGARVMAYDHADVFFWLGAGLVDRVLVSFPSRLEFAHHVRGVPRERLTLVPLTSRERGSPRLAREALGVPPGATLSLTVAAYYKMRPDGHWDYARTLARIMSRHPNHYHLIVGHGQGERPLRRHLKSERVRWLGRRTDVDALLRISDFVVESFPLMGGVFRLDAMREGVPVLAIAHPACPDIFDTGALPADYPLVAQSNAEVERLCARLVEDEALRGEVGASLRRRFERHFSEAAVGRALRDALLSIPTPAPRHDQPFDLSRAPEALTPGPCRFHVALSRAIGALNYSPAMKGTVAARYWAAYAAEALGLRLRRWAKKARPGRGLPGASSENAGGSRAAG